MAPRANLFGKVIPHTSTCFCLKRVVAGQSKKNQSEFSKLSWNPLIVGFASRPSTLLKETVGYQVSLSNACIVATIILVRARGDEEEPMDCTKPNPEKRPPQQLKHWLPAMSHTLITMHQAWQAATQLFRVRVVMENLMPAINLRESKPRGGQRGSTEGGSRKARKNNQPHKVENSKERNAQEQCEISPTNPALQISMLKYLQYRTPTVLKHTWSSASSEPYPKSARLGDCECWCYGTICSLSFAASPFSTCNT